MVKKSLKSSESILKALDILDNPDNWVQHKFAEDSSGHTVDSTSPSACKFCIVGALAKANIGSGSALSSPQGRRQICEAIKSGGYGEFNGSIPNFNDAKNRKHSQVVDVLMTGAFLALAEGN